MPRDVTEPHNEPRTPLEQVTADVLSLIEERLGEDGYEAAILIHDRSLDDSPLRDSVTAFGGFEESSDAFAFMCVHLAAMAEAHGMELRVIPVPGVGRG